MRATILVKVKDGRNFVVGEGDTFDALTQTLTEKIAVTVSYRNTIEYKRHFKKVLLRIMIGAVPEQVLFSKFECSVQFFFVGIQILRENEGTFAFFSKTLMGEGLGGKRWGWAKKKLGLHFRRHSAAYLTAS